MVVCLLSLGKEFSGQEDQKDYFNFVWPKGDVFNTFTEH